MSDFQRIRQLLIDRRYYLSAHAEEEMWADGLERPDIEHCILRGRIERRMTQDVRDTRYRIEARLGTNACSMWSAGFMRPGI